MNLTKHHTDTRPSADKVWDQAHAENDMRDERMRYIAGLYELATVLRNNPHVPLPHEGAGVPISIFIWPAYDDGSSLRDRTAAVARAFPGRIDKVFRNNYLDLTMTLGGPGGLRVDITTLRNAVCERVVTGTETVTKLVKDPVALAAVPEIEVTETVETVRWECGTLLGDNDTPGPVAS